MRVIQRQPSVDQKLTSDGLGSHRRFFRYEHRPDRRLHRAPKRLMLWRHVATLLRLCRELWRKDPDSGIHAVEVCDLTPQLDLGQLDLPCELGAPV